MIVVIYTCTLNPSIDYVIQLEEVQLGDLNISSFNDKQPGGKGINVSRMINRFQVRNQALGFLGGFTGQFVADQLKKEKIETNFIWVEEDTRINLKLKGKEETEINGVSPFISEENWKELLLQFTHLKAGDYVVLSGSVPNSLPKDAYSQIAKQAEIKGIHLFVDAKGEALKSILPYRPFLIKPNHHELGEFFGTTIETVDQAVVYGKKLVEQGAKHVIVSMAEKGAILLSAENCYQANVPKGNVVNSVGSGDSLVGGFLATFSETHSIKEAFHYGVASGSATAFSLGLGEKTHIDELYKQIDISTI